MGIFGSLHCFLVAQMQCWRPWFIPSVGKSPWRREWLLTPGLIACRAPATVQSGGLQSMGLQRVRHNWATNTSTRCCLHARSCPTLLQAHGPSSTRLFWLGCLFLYWAAWAVRKVWRLIPCQPHRLQIFSPTPYIFFWFCWCFPLLCKSFLSLIRSHFFIFGFMSFALRDWSKKILLQFMSENGFSMSSSKSFMLTCLKVFKHFEFFLFFLYIVWESILISLIYTRLCPAFPISLA